MKRRLELLCLAALACQVEGPAPGDLAPANPSVGASPAQPTSDVLPAFALVAAGPSSARLLWVPTDGRRYAVQVRDETTAAWTPADAQVDDDHAMIRDLAEDHEVRLVATDDAGTVVATSVPFRFTPASAPLQTFRGRALLDARQPGWQHTPDAFEGTGPPPAVGSLALRPIDPAHPRQVTHEILSVTPTTRGWRASTRPFTAPQGTLSNPPLQRARAGVQLNVSLDGLPADLAATRPGFVGHCSSSGWGCFELPGYPVDVAPAPGNQQRTTPWYDLASTSLSWTNQTQGVDLSATATGGVQVQFDYEVDLWALSVDRVAARARPYADGQISASIDTDGTDVVVDELLWTSPSITVANFFPVTATAQFDMSGVVEVESDAPVAGSWTGDASFSRTFELGYRDRRFYGPEQIDQQASVQLTPTFGSASEADVWVGWRASGGLALNLLGIEGASATLSPTVGLILHHQATEPTPCGEALSIAHTRIDAGVRLDATLSVVLFGERSFRLAELREPLLGWGRPLDLTVARQVTTDGELGFRLRPRQNPGFATGRPDLTQPLAAFLDGVPTASTATLSDGRFRLQPAPGELTAGSTPTLSVWLPDPGYPRIDLLDSPGTCLSTSLNVEAR